MRRPNNRQDAMKCAEYYDRYAARQTRVGINLRHRSIQRWLEEFGLVPGMEVLEIGCGIGIQTQLIARRLGGTGALVAIDVSPRSVDIARSRLGGRPNVQVITGDAVDLSLERVFDVVVMPDVIEHIPVEHHRRLFANVRRWLKDDGWALIHMPNPFFLDWCHRNRPDLLQEIDQPIFTEMLMGNIVPNDLYIYYLNTYSIWVPEGDYQVIVLKPRQAEPRFRIPTAPTGRGTLRSILGRISDVARITNRVRGRQTGEP
jgi:trans-aconitate 2-methyltransferase